MNTRGHIKLRKSLGLARSEEAIFVSQLFLAPIEWNINPHDDKNIGVHAWGRTFYQNRLLICDGRE